METKDENIIKIIIEYVKEERYKQAILIDGEWGVGKTFFVKEKLLSALQKAVEDKKTYYLSLYGISSTEQIFDEIYSAILGEILETKFGNNKEKVVEKGISFASKLFTAGMKSFNFDIKDCPKLSDLKEIKDLIIIFDDLERCELDINLTLGYINNLVEHNNIKVILVMNQNEIGNINFYKDLSNKFQIALDKRIRLDECKEDVFTKEQLLMRTEQIFGENIRYKKIKEKLIGLTIYYKPNLSEIFCLVVEKFVKNAKEYLLENKQKIVNIFEDSKHYNIRTLIFGVIAFDKFYNICQRIEFESYEYIEQEIDKILLYTMKSSIRIKCGKSAYWWNDNLIRSGIVYGDEKNFKDSIFGYRFVDDYLTQCKLDEVDIIDTIEDIVKKQKSYDDLIKNEESLQLNKLIHPWWKLEDEEVEASIDKIIVELKSMRYEPRYFKNMIIMFMQMEANGFYTFEWKQIVELMGKKIEDYTGKLDSSYWEILSDSEEFMEKYKKIVKPLIDIIDKKTCEVKECDNSFLCDWKLWDDHFGNVCLENRNRYYMENKFFAYIEADKFIHQLQEAKTLNVYNFMEGVKIVYNTTNLNCLFNQDITNLKEILEKLNIDYICGERKTKKIALVNLRNTLNDYLYLLDQNQ